MFPKNIETPKVHVFFEAGGGQGTQRNDVLMHGIRGASDNSEWITITVPRNAKPVTDADILACLQSIAITTPPSALRLTGHFRVNNKQQKTKTNKKNVLTFVDRVVFLDEAVE